MLKKGNEDSKESVYISFWIMNSEALDAENFKSENGMISFGIKISSFLILELGQNWMTTNAQIATEALNFWISTHSGHLNYNNILLVVPIQLYLLKYNQNSSPNYKPTDLPPLDSAGIMVFLTLAVKRLKDILLELRHCDEHKHPADCHKYDMINYFGALCYAVTFCYRLVDSDNSQQYFKFFERDLLIDLASMTSSIYNHHELFYESGYTYMIRDMISGVIKKGCPESNIDYIFIMSDQYFRLALPGEEIWLSEILIYLMSSLPVKSTFISCISQLLGLTCNNNSESLNKSTLLVEVRSDMMGLPMASDWICRALRLLTGSLMKDENDFEGSILDGFLHLAIAMETHNPSDEVLKSINIHHLMHIFLIESSLDCEIFQLVNISSSLKQLIDIYTTSNSVTPSPTIYELAGGGSVFYNLYQNLVTRFASVSFGDTNFARILMIPLQMNYPVDFKHVFWLELNEQLLMLELKEDSLPYGLKNYLEPLEKDETMIEIYLKFISRTGAEKERLHRSIFYKIANHHLAGYLTLNFNNSLSTAINSIIK
jgi:hypothetical protein